MSALRRRGQPLASLALILAGWVGVRAVVWEPPFAVPGLVEPPPVATRDFARAEPQPTPAGQAERAVLLDTPHMRPPEAEAGVFARPPLPASEPMLPLARVAAPIAAARTTMPVAPPSTQAAPAAANPHLVAAHQLLYLAALGQLPLPPGLALIASPPRPASLPPSVLAGPRGSLPARWSGDGWVLLRHGSGGLAAASGFPAYGASQAGGVVRFALAPGSPRAPQAYLRISRALGGFDDGEVAAGLSARPFAAIPLRLLGEARVQRSSGVTRVRPAASVVSELPPARLPLGIEGEAYAQAGYAGAPFGSKHGATPFFDVQAVADRRLASAGPAELRLGAGAWSGGQKGAARLDIGLHASARLGLGPANSRLTLDYRFRVAGDARPGSGPTLTFSAGF